MIKILKYITEETKEGSTILRFEEALSNKLQVDDRILLVDCGIFIGKYTLVLNATNITSVTGVALYQNKILIQHEKDGYFKLIVISLKDLLDNITFDINKKSFQHIHFLQKCTFTDTILGTGLSVSISAGSSYNLYDEYGCLYIISKGFKYVIDGSFNKPWFTYTSTKNGFIYNII